MMKYAEQWIESLPILMVLKSTVLKSLRGFLVEMFIPQIKPTRLLSDSQSAISLTYNPVFHKRTKHVMIKVRYLIEYVETDQIILEFVRTHLNFADCLTKMQKLAFFKQALVSLRVCL